ncbi:hypothetical protein [Leptospira alstonii]|uniref:Uncharacterized protein n=2 Tax=Leptospira alstonii TaxID=28452 RepID=M6CZ71_9LEPT|nr:hypothetical protein [Leptospira alstonii]EMJ95796.1 hypothetical protein LEP1GSC194_3324 [Leptospira alstonii serovar Sichuan str. 79601]EQA79515.1 hypothetical protein LEP1GSC193_0576 [Leptospira alstonii serovar Pingchang str. 80-412]
MGLAVVVGILSEDWYDPETLDSFRKEFEKVNRLLADNDLPLHKEPERLPVLENRCELDSYPYSYLHYLRRAYAYRVNDPTWMAEPILDSEDPAFDPVVEEETDKFESHLLCHSDAEGFYIPIDFHPVLFEEEKDQILGGMLGSSQGLLEELIFVAPALGIQLKDGELSQSEVDAINSGLGTEEGVWIERTVWLSLFEAARLSIKHGTAICFC